MLLSFHKGHANGNDFIFVSANDFPAKYRTKKTISAICSRNTGIGADGFFIISKSKKYDFELTYYNCDGSRETLCANGSRCAVRLMYENKKIDLETVFLAGDGPHSAKIHKNSMISMQMKAPVYKSNVLSSEGLNGYFIDSGAKHFVIESKNLDDSFVFSMGRKIRRSPQFSPSGINVNFYTLIDSHTIHIKTYEKGVEALMSSCSSGSAAVVFHLATSGLIKNSVKTISNGGALNFSFNNKCNTLWCEGPAMILINGYLNMNYIIC